MTRIACAPLALLAALFCPRPLDAQTPSDEELVANIESGEKSLEAFQIILGRTGEDRLVVAGALNDLSRKTKDAAVKDRCRIVLDAILQKYLAEHKKREVQERYDDLQTACKDLLTAARDKKVASGKLVASAEKALESFEESLAKDEPLNPPPFRVPMGGRPAPGGQPKAPPRPAPGAPPAGLDGYEKIQVGDKTMLVPKDTLPEHYVPEVVDGQLRIIRFETEAEKKAYLEKKEKEKGGKDGKRP